MAGKYYAVKVGIKPGIYRSWDECKKRVDKYSGAIYKSFTTEAEAISFMGDVYLKNNSSDAIIEKKEDIEKTNCGDNYSSQNKAYAFVDGSYNQGTKVYGFGGFVMNQGEKYIISGCGQDEEMASMRNVAGEVLGSMAAIEKAMELHIKEIDIYYDYMGIEMWATGAWKRNKKGTIAYYEFMQRVKDKIKVNFVKVKGHSGVEGNEEADILAKKAVNIL